MTAHYPYERHTYKLISGFLSFLVNKCNAILPANYKPHTCRGLCIPAVGSFHFYHHFFATSSRTVAKKTLCQLSLDTLIREKYPRRRCWEPVANLVISRHEAYRPYSLLCHLDILSSCVILCHLVSSLFPSVSSCFPLL